MTQEAPLSPARAILYGTLVVGTLDISDAILFFGLHNHVPPSRIFHTIAGGLLGREAARAGGLRPGPGPRSSAPGCAASG